VLVSRIPYDVDVHTIPARDAEPAHVHYDCRFLYRATASSEVTISDEAHGYRWIPITDLAGEDTPQSLRRMALKSVRTI
jgi:hypothetical protein